MSKPAILPGDRVPYVHHPMPNNWAEWKKLMPQLKALPYVSAAQPTFYLGALLAKKAELEKLQPADPGWGPGVPDWLGRIVAEIETIECFLALDFGCNEEGGGQ